MIRAFVTLLLFGTPLYSQQTSPLETLMVLRDTVSAVSAATWEFNRDLAAAGAETVLARGRHLSERCRAADRSLRAASSVLAPRAEARAFLEATQRFRNVLLADCDRAFAPAGVSTADSLRAWGPYYSARIERAVGEYEAAMSRFSVAVGVTLEPRLPKRP